MQRRRARRWLGAGLACLAWGVGAIACGGASEKPPAETPEPTTEAPDPMQALAGTWKTPGYDYRIIFAASGEADVWNQSRWCGRYRFEIEGDQLKWRRADEQPEVPLGVEPAMESLCRTPDEQGPYAIDGKELTLSNQLRLWRESGNARLVP